MQVKNFGFFLALSLILHFLVSTSTLYFAEKLGFPEKKDSLTEIQLLEETDKPTDQEIKQKIEDTKQLVKQLQNTVKKIQEKSLRARFESEQTQRVEKETRVDTLGISQNSNPTQNQNTKVPPSEKTEEPEFAREVLNKKNYPNNGPQLPLQNSSISINLNSDIELSNATNLNTDANIYYSFYSRVEDLFYVRWVERNNYYWNKIDYNFKKNNLAGKIWTTVLEVILTSTGEFHTAIIHKPSGYKAFDEAAVYAFKNARFFPNPPKEKIDADGFVRLKYRFNVHVSALR